MSALPNSAYEYQVGGSLPINAPTYVRRQADQDIYENLKKGQFCYVLNSRQMGKSSLRVQVMQRLQQEGFACAAVDITAIGTADITPEQWYAGVIDTLVGSFNLYSSFDLETWWTENGLLSPVQRLSKFIETVLLELIDTNIVIFIDEIDSILSLNFNTDDFFTLIRECYNRRANQPAYSRLTFAILGVSTPSDLIQLKGRTPFNIGRAIDLTGFQLHEAKSLARGLETVGNPQALMQEVLKWTGGQPFLTQKLCKLVLNVGVAIPTGEEAAWVESLVREQVIKNWEAQDEPEHLKTIRDRLLRSVEQRTGRLLGLCQQIFQQGEIVADDSREQMELRLTGLVVKRNGKLRIYNPIYEAVFSFEWCEQELAKLRPYADALKAWIASGKQDESCLLRDETFKAARKWSVGKSLSDLDYQFLDASQELEKRVLTEANRKFLDANQELEKRVLTEANRSAKRKIHRSYLGIAVTATGVLVSLTAWVGTTSLEKLLQEYQIWAGNQQSTRVAKTPEALPICRVTAATIPPGVIPKEGVKIMIDPGHGMIPPDTGKLSRLGIDGLREEDVVLPISKKVADILAKNGVQAMLTRDTDCVLVDSVADSLRYRTQMANLVNATLFVSIHATAFNGKTKGVETYYSGDSSKRLAQLVQNSMLESLSGSTDRGVWSGDSLYTLKNISMPGIHIETGFIDNKEDAARLRNPEYQNKMAEAIASGILQYLKQQKIGS